nr:C-type lectin domain family 4 member A-like [Marmota flaviventris]
MEAHLVVINSKEEQDFLTQIMDKAAAYFMGLLDPEGHGHWQWVDQTPYNQGAMYVLPLHLELERNVIAAFCVAVASGCMIAWDH